MFAPTFLNLRVIGYPLVKVSGCEYIPLAMLLISESAMVCFVMMLWSLRYWVNQFRVLLYLDERINVLRNLIFQIQLLQINEQIQNIFLSFSSDFPSIFYENYCGKCAYDLPYLPRDSPRLLMQVSQSKSTIGHWTKNFGTQETMYCRGIFMSSGMWQRNLAMLAG